MRRPAHGRNGTAPRRLGRLVILGPPLVLGLCGIVFLAVSSSSRTGPNDPVIGVGFGPVDMALDRRSGHIFVLEGRGIDARGMLINSGTVSTLAVTGAVIRRAPVGESPSWISIVEGTRRAFVVASAGPTFGSVSVQVLDTTTGAVLRTVPLLTAPAPPAAVPGPGGALNVSAGSSTQMGPGAVAVDAVAGHVFVVNRVAYPPAPPRPIISMLDARTGVLRAVLHLPAAAFAAVADSATHHLFVTSATTGAVWMLDSRTGVLLRTLLTAGPGGVVAIDHATRQVLVATPGAPGQIRLFAARDGHVLTTITARAPAAITKIAVDEQHGRAFLLEPGTRGPGNGAGPGHVVLLTLPGGRLVGSVPVDGDPVDVALQESRGRVFVAVQARYPRTGAAVMLDARTGRLLASWGAGFWPTAVLVDEATNRVFVLNQQAYLREYGGLAALTQRIRNAFFPGGNEERGVITIHHLRD